MGEILVATSGYSYDDWVGPVYPKGTDRRDFLPLYARRFGFTELNFTYYREPTAGGLAQIAAKVPDSFRFVIKAHRSLTHDRSDDWKRGAERFLEALEGLRPAAASARGGADLPGGEPRTAGADDRPGPVVTRGEHRPPARPDRNANPDRLLGVLLQFPYSFHYDEVSRRYLASVLDCLDSARLFVEFRNDEWEKDSVWREMERRQACLVVPDLPGLDGLPSRAPRITGDLGYVRFHGRNAANWWNGTNVTRYDYRYSVAELEGWVEPVRQMAAKAEAVIVTFNNHFAGQAVANAEELMALLGLTA